tara:strand:- start:3300 stop:3464 length:165 start_codon:yes stop_codon:yes gene_type:complete
MPEVKIGKKKIKLPYTKAGKKLALKLRKKKKRDESKNYQQIPTGNGDENPIGGN